MQGFDSSATPAPQYQQQYQYPANIPVDPTAVGQLQHQQWQRQYGGEGYGGEGYGGKEYGGEEYCGEEYGEWAGGRGFYYESGGFGGTLGGGGDDPVMTGILNSSSCIYDPDMMKSRMRTSTLNASKLGHDAIMRGWKSASELI